MESNNILNQDDFIVVLPVFNESEAIEAMILSIIEQGYSLVITDGGSTDGSIEIARKFQIPIIHRPGKGKGFGLDLALKYASKNGYKYIVYMDCDMTYPTSQIKDLLVFRHQFDMAVGNRSRRNMTLKSRVLNFLITIVLNILFSKQLQDPASGFRVLEVNKFVNKIQAYGIDVEFDLLGIAYRNQYSIKEVDIDYYTRVGESKLSFFELIKVIFTIVQVRFFHKVSPSER